LELSMESDREALRLALEEQLADPCVLEEYRHHAAEIIATGASRTVAHPDGVMFEALDVEERDAYLNELIDHLAPALMRFVFEWTTTDMVLISEWLATRDGSA
jgi:hypothetical protein